MNKGEKVQHSIYGEAVVEGVIKSVSTREGKMIQDKGLILELLTDEGKAQYSKDRNGILPFLFENDFSKITKA